MATRETLFRQFGPLLIEAMFDFLLDNVNTLRVNQGMPPITKQEYIELLTNHLSELEPYDWMSEE